MQAQPPHTTTQEGESIFYGGYIKLVTFGLDTSVGCQRLVLCGWAVMARWDDDDAKNDETFGGEWSGTLTGLLVDKPGPLLKLRFFSHHLLHHVWLSH